MLSTDQFTSNEKRPKKSERKTEFKMTSTSECITWFAVFVTGSVIIASVNLLTIIVFLKNRNLRTRAMYLVINLTLADMLVGLLSGSLSPSISLRFSCDFLNVTLYSLDLFYFLVPFSPLVSVTNITVISLERMHATFRPFKHRVITKWVYGVAITAVWIFPAMVLSVAIFRLNFGSPNKIIIFWPIYYCFCLFVICVSYACISIKFLCGAHPQHHGAVNRQRKLTVTLFIMTTVSLLLSLPLVLHLFVLHATNSTHIFTSPPFAYSSVVLVGVNSFVNPILYSVRIPEFKQALISIFRRRQIENVDIPL